jgi:hypothetical protein
MDTKYDCLTVFAEFKVTYTDPSKHVRYSGRPDYGIGFTTGLPLQQAKSGLSNVRPFWAI